MTKQWTGKLERVLLSGGSFLPFDRNCLLQRASLFLKLTVAKINLRLIFALKLSKSKAVARCLQRKAFSQDVIGRHNVGLWKAIRKKWWLLDGRLAYHVGNGQRVRFWKAKWCGDGPLCESFSSLFSISMSKNAWVSEVWNPVGDGDD
ncbi:hypothetical protein CK203_008380 [Vitis vinifera]|uniref:Uncharacterized protein n=1 Tax=Vitis vinifera TaxID=29760 RepID=A0A438KNT7_VITVI|nr:hypothetical protein CK203_008380 [Vitis vinifera]